MQKAPKSDQKVTHRPTGPNRPKIDYPEPERHFQHAFSINWWKTDQKQQKNIVFRCIFHAKYIEKKGKMPSKSAQPRNGVGQKGFRNGTPRGVPVVTPWWWPRRGQPPVRPGKPPKKASKNDCFWCVFDVFLMCSLWFPRAPGELARTRPPPRGHKRTPQNDPLGVVKKSISPAPQGKTTKKTHQKMMQKTTPFGYFMSAHMKSYINLI